MAGYRIDPLNNARFGTAYDEISGGAASLGNGNGWGTFDFKPFGQDFNYGDPNSVAGDPYGTDPKAVSQWLAKSGYSLMENDDATERWLEDAEGNQIGERQQFADDKDFLSRIAMIAALATGVGAMAGGAGAAGGAAATAGGSAGATAGGATAAGVNWGAVGSGALKGAALNGGVTLARGGSLQEALKSAAIGGVTGGVGSGVGAAFGNVAGSAAAGATGAAINGGSGSEMLKAGAIGAAGSFINSSVGDQFGKTAGNAVSSAATTALRGGSAQDALVSGVTGALRTAAGPGTSARPSNTTSSQGGSMDFNYSPNEVYDTYMGYDDAASQPGYGTVSDTFMGYDDAGSSPTPSFRPSDTYGPVGMTGNQTSVFDSILNLTGDRGAAATGADIAGGDWTSALGTGWDWLKSSLAKSGGAGGGGAGGNNWLRDALGLVGAGAQQWNLERMAQDNRDWQSAEKDKDRNWQDSRDAQKRARQAPVAVAAGSLSAFRRGG